MEIYTVPDIFIARQKMQNDGLYIKQYTTDVSSGRNKIIVNKTLITFMLEGEKELHFSDSTVSVSNTEVVIIPEGNCLMTEKLSKSGGYHSILFFIDNDRISDFLFKYGLYPQKSRDLIKASDPFYTFCKDPFIDAYLRSLDSILAGSGMITKQMAGVKLEELFLYLVEKNNGSFADFLSQLCAAPPVLNLRKVVEDNAYTNITLEEIAFLCHMSLATFKRHFNNVYGVAPGKWFHDKKMKRAEFLLMQQARPTDIYTELGYENLSAFIKAYKKEFGKTPKAARLAK